MRRRDDHLRDEDLHRSRVEGRSRRIPNWYELDWEHVARACGHGSPPADTDVTLEAADPVAHNAELMRDAIDALR